MGAECHQIRSLERPTTTKATNFGSAVPYTLHRSQRLSLLLSLRNTSLLASVDTIHDLLYVIQRFNFRNSESPFSILSVVASVVTVFVLLPSEAPSLSRASSNQKIYFWVSPSRHHLNGRICGFRYRVSRVFTIIPGDQEYSSHPRFQFQNSDLPRLCIGNGHSICFERIL